LDGSGYLLPLGRLGAEIIVNRSDPIEVRRFTIAHELGHWALGLICQHKFGKFQQPTMSAGRAEIERWCDSFATSLLMPRGLVDSVLTDQDSPTFIDTILRGCRDFNVSKQAFFLRIWELSRIQVVALRKQMDTSPYKQFEVERNYGDQTSNPALADFFQNPTIQTQLGIGGPLIFFAGMAGDRSFRCSGRRTSNRHLTIAIMWKDNRGSNPKTNSRSA